MSNSHLFVLELRRALSRLKDLFMLFLLLISSCHELVDDDFQEFKIYPVVNGVLIADSTISIHISLSALLKDTIIPDVSDAVVVIQNSNNILDTLKYQGKGMYKSLQVVKAGMSYRCKVLIPNFAVLEAETNVPIHTPIHNVVFTDTAGLDEEGLLVSEIKYTINPNLKMPQFWEVKFIEKGVSKDSSFFNKNFKNESQQRDMFFYLNPSQDEVLLHETLPLTVFSNAKMKDSAYVIRYKYNENNIHFNPKFKYYIVLRSIDQSFYKYKKQLYLNETSGSTSLGSSIKNFSPYSNIKNGYGIFTSYSESSTKFNF
jgi:hypothetical protein